MIQSTTALPLATRVNVKTLGVLSTVLGLMSAAQVQASVIDTADLNKSLKDSLTTGVSAGTQLACTGIGVFLGNAVVKWVFGLVLLVSLVSLAWAWYSNSRNNAGFSRLFFILVGGMCLLALVGFLFSNWMGCKV